MKQKKMIGLLAGMGPYASAYFYKLLLDKSSSDFGAINNDDFPEIVLDSVPVPDFISDIEQLETAREILLSRVTKLNAYGCTIIAMVCNTAHLLYSELSGVSSVPFISLIEVVSNEVRAQNIRRVGLFATKTTLKTKLYQKALEEAGVEVFTLGEKEVEIHEEIIRDVVAQGDQKIHQDTLLAMTERFIKKDSLDGIILGCTELPLVFPKEKITDTKIVDCLDVLANSLLTHYYQK